MADIDEEGAEKKPQGNILDSLKLDLEKAKEKNLNDSKVDEVKVTYR